MKELHRNAFTVGSLTLLSRITGLVREVVHARFLGTGMAADAFRVAFLLPNLLRRLVGEGAVASAFVPVYTEWSNSRGEAEARTFAEKFISLWLLLVTAATAAGIALAGWIIYLCFHWGTFRDPAKLELTTELSRLLFPYLILIGGVAAAQGILNARGIFASPAFAPVVFNIVFVAGVFGLVPLLGEERTAFAMAVAVLLGGVGQLAVLVPPLRRLGIRLAPSNPFSHKGVRDVMRLLAPATLGAGVYQINVMASTALAARLEEGAVASLSYSNRLMEFVLGIFVFALSTVSLTALSRHMARSDRAAFEDTASEVFRLIAFITVPSTVGLYLLRRPVIAVLFEGGKFGPDSLELTAAAFRYHVLGMLFIGWNRILVACFYARKDIRTPVVQGFINLLFNLALSWWLSEGPLRHAGIALASTLAAILQGAALFWLLLRRMPGLRIHGLFSTTLRTLIASAVMGVACDGALRLVWTPALEGRFARGAAVAFVIAVGVAVFFAAAWALRLKEVRVFTALLRGRRPVRGK
ncbi:MAG TPA: murein biosynthesis integral membrane protein MurJ [Planctomycetota bacterium]|nr:murein biosynthesis integral membrane protein MurJ [Planctomycetota bacterium]